MTETKTVSKRPVTVRLLDQIMAAIIEALCTLYFSYRAMELCQELNLLSGVSHHEKSAGRMLLTEQEQAK